MAGELEDFAETVSELSNDLIEAGVHPCDVVSVFALACAALCVKIGAAFGPEMGNEALDDAVNTFNKHCRGSGVTRPLWSKPTN